MSDLKTLSWGERFAVINALNPTDEQIQVALSIDADELATARELLDSGQFTAVKDIDTAPYAEVFDAIAITETEVVKPTRGSVTATRARNRTPAASATRTTRSPKKRGRKGTKIQEAFAAINTTPVSAETFATQHSVSLNVLRQAKRFDRSGITGRVRVKLVKGTLSIFREATEK